MPKRRLHSSLTRRDCERWADAAIRELYRTVRNKKPIGATAGGPVGLVVPFVPPPWDNGPLFNWWAAGSRARRSF
jgi:hypothetical protein